VVITQAGAGRVQLITTIIPVIVRFIPVTRAEVFNCRVADNHLRNDTLAILTLLTVSTLQRRTSARTAVAHVIDGTGVSVATRRHVIGRDTSLHLVAAIIRADITIVANDYVRKTTPAIATDISRCARVFIVAIGHVIRENASRCNIATIIRTRIVIVTNQCIGSGLADSVLADIS